MYRLIHIAVLATRMKTPAIIDVISTFLLNLSVGLADTVRVVVDFLPVFDTFFNCFAIDYLPTNNLRPKTRKMQALAFIHKLDNLTI